MYISSHSKFYTEIFPQKVRTAKKIIGNTMI